MTNSIVSRQPGKMLRFALHLPTWLYRLHLGWLFGNRFLMLTHRGRKSGLPYQTVIEVVQYDNRTNTCYVVSGWGEKSDWYQNIRQSPHVTIYVGGRKLLATAEFIPLEKAAEILETYVHDHPVAFRELSGLFLGERVKPDKDAARRLTAKMPMVAFHPMQAA
ncbi:MAG TPA: nitroreductase family deazaflavin-dependent oxidoreductase [Anaerolineales bacterium]|jgi:deazaflavin-dependent oxidoreductase (nitroreductase family)|nr:nitroreductase family deazaflavin-dependent oxidoreductase [Anaerolineales bacterium]